MKYNIILFTSHHIQRHCGNVFDYFLENTENFFYFSHAPGFNPSPCVFEVYRNGVKQSAREFFLYKGKNIKLQYLFYYFYYLYIAIFLLPKKVVIINVNPVFCWFNSLISFLKKHTTIFWIYDHFPTTKRFDLYNFFDEYYNKHLQYVLYLGPALQEYYGSRSKKGTLYYRDMLIFGQKKAEYLRSERARVLGFLGHLKQYQGVDLIFDALKNNQDLFFEIIGDGPQKEYLQQKAHLMGVSERVIFYGFIPQENIADIIKNWQIGLAPYEPVKENFTNFAHPGKVVLYLQYGLPVIMTKVSHMQKKIVDYKMGEIVDFDTRSLLDAIKLIRENYSNYLQGVQKFNDDYEYQKYYDNKFKFIASPDKLI